MKVYSISKWAFMAISLLILVLPVSRHWKLLSTGEKTPGKVTQLVTRTKELMGKETESGFASEIEFMVDGNTYHAYGPLNYEYSPGRCIMVYYHHEDPSLNCIATFSGFYLTNYTVVPIIVLTLWYAFYLSFNNYRRKQKFKKRGPRRSTYPSRRIPCL